MKHSKSKRQHNSGLLPNFLICGAPKAGTSSLHIWLADHPDVLGSIEKETYFFVDPGSHMYRAESNVLNGLASYSKYFDLKSTLKPKIVLESTPSYMYYDTALRFIPDLPSKPKCLFILREPAQQIYSLFSYFQTNWSWIAPEMRFAEYLDLIRRGVPATMFGGNELAAKALEFGRYVEFLSRWRERLGDERMMVRSFECLKNDPQSLLLEIAEWLKLDPGFYANYKYESDNKTYAVRNNSLQRVNVAIRSKLPKGRFYKVLRSIYHTVNTRRPQGPSQEETELIRNLSAEFAEPNARLREIFGMDLAGWA